jgi:hypothetical protein
MLERRYEIHEDLLPVIPLFDDQLGLASVNSLEIASLLAQGALQLVLEAGDVGGSGSPDGHRLELRLELGLEGLALPSGNWNR